MTDTIIGEFSVLSPSQKRELERKRKEQEARETAEAIRKAEAARKAKEAATRAEEERLAAIRAENAARESKKNILKLGIAVLCVLIIIVIWLWIHSFNVFCSSVFPDIDTGTKILYGIFYFVCTAIIAGPILGGMVSGIEKLKDKIKDIK